MGKTLYLIADSKVETFQWLFRVGESEFDIYMRMDTNTNGHRQWFYFSVKNLLPGPIKFNVYRFKKKFSLFQRGMKPYIRSLKAKENWKPGGTKITYRCEKQPTQYGVVKEKTNYYMSFQYKFIHPQDEVFFSSGLPYTVSYMRSRLDTFCATQLINGISCRVTSITKSMCGQDLPLLTIESSQKTYNKNYIVINARTHAGETSCSWVLDGLIEKIIESEDAQQWIKENNISLKIVPMLNIDGVFMGNYRTGIMGQDFNRKFATGKKQIFPQLFALKKVISECKKNGKLFMFLDLHGHSILKNSFIYGPIESLFQKNPLRVLPFNLWHGSKYFRLSSCKFRFEKDLTETARVYFQIRDCILTYTCQISLGLYYQNGKTIQFMESDYKSFGASIADSFVELLTVEKMKNYQPLSQENQKMVPVQNQQFPIEKTKKDPATRLPSFKKQKQLYLQKIKKARHQINQQFKSKAEKNRDDENNNCSRERDSKLEKIQHKKYISQERQESHERLMDTRAKKFSIGSEKRSIKNVSLKNKSALPLNNTIKSIKIDTQEQRIPEENKKGIKIFYNQQLKNNKQSKQKRFKETHQIPKSLKKKDIEQSERSSEFSLNELQKKQINQVQFKVRRKSDILRILPESLRKKVIFKNSIHPHSTSKYFSTQKEQEQEPFVFERSVTYDPTYGNKADSQLYTEPNDLEQIDENFSEDYSSMNDEDSSSEDLNQKEKQYLLQCIRNNRKLHTQNDENEDQEESDDEMEDNSQSPSKNINRFKEIRFKSIEPIIKLQSSGHQNARLTKREPYKFRDFNHKSLCKNYFEEDTSANPPNIAQRKHLNERIHRKTQREPYFLIQIKSKNN